MESVIISSTCWVPRGKAKQHPQSYIHSADYIDSYENEEGGEIHRNNGEEKNDNNSQNGGEKAAKDEGAQEDENFTPGDQFFTEELRDILREDMRGEELEDSEEEEENEIRPTDLLLLCASAEDDASTIEVYVYDEDNESFFVHHDFLVCSYPLCLEWLSECPHADKKNVVAMGCFEPLIHIWDLDVLDRLDPVVSLGEEKTKSVGKKKGEENQTNLSVDAHKSAVMCLHKNAMQTNILASSSADETVKVWDVVQASCLHTYTHHQGKVQSVRWHTQEASVFLSAAFDNSLAILDARTPTSIAKVPLSSDVESSMWSRQFPYMTIVSTESGEVVAHDIRKLSESKESRLFCFSAHAKATTCVADSTVPNLLVTCSMDEKAKVWNLAAIDKNQAPALVFEKDLKAGGLYNCAANPDMGHIFAFGGRCPVIWDLTNSEEIVNAFNLPT